MLAELVRDIRSHDVVFPIGTTVEVGDVHHMVNNRKVTLPNGRVMYLSSAWYQIKSQHVALRVEEIQLS